MAERNALMPFVEGTRLAVNHLWNPRPGYVNQSDGSVGILGKAFGSLGLDADGARGATGWEDAWRNSVDADTSGRQASMLPITSDGGYGVPTMLSAPLEGFNAMWERGDEANVLNPEFLRQSSEESFDAAGLAATGGLAAGALGAVPEGAIAANGIGRQATTHLPMDDASRLARAKEMGFDTSKTWYHGTDRQFDAFDLNARRDYPALGGHPDDFGKGVYVTEVPEIANGWSNRLDLFTRAQNPFRVTVPVVGEQEAAIKALYPEFDGFLLGDKGAGFTEALKRAGYDAVDVVDNSGMDMMGNKVDEPVVFERVVFDPKNLRRTDAAFDPAQSDSANLLYSNSPTSAAVPMAMSALERHTVPTGRGSLLDAHAQFGQDMPFDQFQAMAREAGLTDPKQPHRLNGELLSPETEWMHGTALPSDADLIVPDGYYGVHMTRSPDVAGIYGERGAVRGYDEGFNNPFTLPPRGAPGYDHALSQAQEYLPGFDGTKASLENNAASYSKILRDRGYDSIVSKDDVLLDDAFEGIAFNPNSMHRLYANSPTSAAAPLAFTDNEDNSRNALMPPRHHSFSQNRSASGQFSK